MLEEDPAELEERYFGTFSSPDPSVGRDNDARGNGYKREKWAHKIEFVLSGIGFAVGLGNVWRFPYLCYKNGGGAFLIPYIITVITAGLPIFLMEIAMGQYTSEGGITAWKMCPLFKGIGYATTFVCGLLNIYYIVILAWALHYFYNSFKEVLPWTTCGNWWNSRKCFTRVGNSTMQYGPDKVDSVVEYWERKVLGITKDIAYPGGFQWELVLCLFIVWVLVYFCVWKGIKTSGKVVYFTALFPYVMLTVLFIRGITLDGAMDGIKYYLKPDFSKLRQSQVWIDAGTQVFFSYAIAIGCMTALGSYNKFNNNFVKDCFSIAITNTCTSLYAGFAIFSVLGYMAKEHGVPIAKVAESGPGLVFIAYPKATMMMPFSPIWSALFFFMILLMGIDSQFVGVEGFVTAIVDIFPVFFRKRYRKELFIAILCLISFGVGLSMVTRGGMYIFQLFDYYAASGSVLLCICFCECISISYFYGVNRFMNNITSMVGFQLNGWFRYCWLYFTPVVTMGVMIFTLLSFAPLTYNRTYEYPLWAQYSGWFMSFIPISFIPFYFVYYWLSRPADTIRLKWRMAMQPRLNRSERNQWPR